MKIAAVVNNLGPSQMAFYLIKEFNELARDSKNSCSVFAELSGVYVTRPLFACYTTAFLPEYNGVAISTTIEEARSLLQVSSNAKKYLYLWNLDWASRPVDHAAYCAVLRDPRLQIIARSEDHAKAIENFCNKKPVGVVDDWNHKSLLEILGEQNEQN